MQIHVPPQLNMENLNSPSIVRTSDRSTSRQCVALKSASGFHLSRIAEAVGDIGNQASDICLISSSGETVHTNRLILALASPFLAHLIEDVPCCAEPVLVLPHVNSEIITHIVRIITDGFTTNYFGDSLSHILEEIDEIMDTAKTLDIAIVDLNYEDDNSANADPNNGNENEESRENEIRMEEDSSETIDSDFYVEYEFLKEFEDNAINLKLEATSGDSYTESIGNSEHDGTFINECNILENVPENLVMLRNKTEEIELENGFFCNNCPLSFSNFNDWEVHVKIHSEEWLFELSNCPKHFDSEQSKENQTIEPDTGCEVDDVCDKMFYKKRLLRNHIMAHTFIRKKIICKRSHIRKKHTIDEGFIVKCKICQKTFYDKEMLGKHYAKHDITEFSL